MHHRSPRGVRLPAAAGALLLALAWVLPAGAAEISAKLQKQIKLIEQVISEVIVESPNWLVSSGGPVTGTYLEGYGAVFSFDASLVGSKSSGTSWGKLGKGFIVWDDKKEKFTFESDEKTDEEESLRDRKDKREDRRYERGKEELAEALIDYADALSELADEEWVVLVVALDEDHDYFQEQDLHRLILKAKVGDLKRHAAGSLADSELASRIAVEQY
jgi:hypothetical protein